MQKIISGGLLLIAAFLFVPANVVESQKVVYCYWGTWAYYRSGEGKFDVSFIDTNLCTHIGYAFFGVGDDDQIKSLDQFLDFDLQNIKKTIALKQQKPNLKVMASVGGWGEGSVKYSAMASSAARRATFIKSAIAFLGKYSFDGLDFDWEYPAQRGGSPDDKANFVSLLSGLSAALKPLGLLLSIAVAAGEATSSVSYDIPNIAKHVDLINVMTYDFVGSYDSKTGFTAPLEGQGQKNVKTSISYWLRSGAPANKIVMGMPSYGRSFTLANSAENTPGSPSATAGTAGPISGETGVLGYLEICQNIKSGWTRVFDRTTMVPYAYKGNQWVGYDDKESLKLKVNYLKSQNLAGGMVWSLETDDFRGKCGEKFPLLKTINAALNG